MDFQGQIPALFPGIFAGFPDQACLCYSAPLDHRGRILFLLGKQECPSVAEEYSVEILTPPGRHRHCRPDPAPATQRQTFQIPGSPEILGQRIVAAAPP